MTLTDLWRAGRPTQYRLGQRAPAGLLATMSAGPLAVNALDFVRGFGVSSHLASRGRE